MQGLVEVKEYGSAAEMIANAAALRNKFMGAGRPKKPAQTAQEPAVVYRLVQWRAWNVPFNTHVTAYQMDQHERRQKELQARVDELEGMLEADGLPVDQEPFPRVKALTVTRSVLAQCALDGEGDYTIEDIRSDRRNRKIVKVRHACMVAVHEKCRHMSDSAIGRFFHRDHTVIRYALQKAGLL